MAMERTLINQTVKKAGRQVKLCGWVATRRDHGKLVFIDLRDRTGIVQIVGGKELAGLRPEDVVEIVGKVKKRPDSMANDRVETGQVEVGVLEVKVLARAADLPIPIGGDSQVQEELRLKYRYLDLRSSRMSRNLRLRHRVIKFIRDWLDKDDFVEIETPILTKATPEGARDFLVPSRLQPGNFYALPQSPQQYKQLLMVAGFERYYQIARCFRDEDPRADRAYGEFTQLDLEMSFTSQEEILALIEKLLKDLVEKVLGKKVAQYPFPRLTYKEVMEKYKTDKPDLCKDKNDKKTLAFCFVVDFPLFEKAKEKGGLTPSHHPFTAPKDQDISLLGKDPEKVRSWQHDLVCNGLEVGGGSLRITDPDLQEKVFEVLGHKKKEIKEKFGHLLSAFDYGVPPHGGIALGIERLLMVFLEEDSTREVTAFPMTSGGQTSVMQAPSEVNSEQLQELGLGKKGPKAGK